MLSIHMDHSLHKVSMSQFILDGLLEKLKEIFLPELWLVKGVKAYLTCKK